MLATRNVCYVFDFLMCLSLWNRTWNGDVGMGIGLLELMMSGAILGDER